MKISKLHIKVVPTHPYKGYRENYIYVRVDTGFLFEY